MHKNRGQPLMDANGRESGGTAKNTEQRSRNQVARPDKPQRREKRREKLQPPMNGNGVRRIRALFAYFAYSAVDVLLLPLNSRK